MSSRLHLFGAGRQRWTSAGLDASRWRNTSWCRASSLTIAVGSMAQSIRTASLARVAARQTMTTLSCSTHAGVILDPLLIRLDGGYRPEDVCRAVQFGQWSNLGAAVGERMSQHHDAREQRHLGEPRE